MAEHPTALGEFDLIAKYFTRPVKRAALGIGDDCALLQPTAGMQLAISSDMLVEGRHFLSTVLPQRLGHKALAVNLSDLAAAGAQPLAFSLALALPRADESFLAGFAQGLFALADEQGCELIGGDTTQGPLNICITVFGEVPPGQALLRSGARVGDDLYVSGSVGDARLALECFRGNTTLAGDAFERVRFAMEQPQPRVRLGVALRGIATSAIDVSDGLLGDLGHILNRSAVGATIEVDAVPRSAVLASQPLALQRECTLAGGDDYELIFTAPASHADAVQAAARQAGVPVTRIGHVDRSRALALVDAQGRSVPHTFGSFDHFKTA
jgi:thiamine-monophosphate kinase